VARLVSQAKLGYYPTPPEVVDHLRQAFVFDPDVRLLDPCCGAGEALAEIAKGQPVETFGIELERDRYVRAKEALSHVLWGDALKEVSVSAGFDMLYLNPPYDFDEGEGKRLEHRFLTRYRRAVAPQGLVVMVFPLSALRSEPLRNEIARHLAMLVAAGFCNGAEIKDPQDPSRTLLVKGTVQAASSVQSKEETDTHDVTHIIHTHKIRIRMLSVSEGTIEEIE